jgi:methylglutaconyl-CoA hydratase
MSAPAIDIRRDGDVEWVMLDRPAVRNAFNDQVIDELSAWAARAAADSTLRAVVLGGAGKVFSAGADLDWMARGAEASHEQIERQAATLHDLFAAIDSLPQAVVGRVQGAAIAGGGGLVAVCDVVVAAEEATFGFSEVKLGIVPAIISPFVIRKIGPSAARALFVTGQRIDARRAREIGLVHEVVPASELDAAVAGVLAELGGASPTAVAAAKRLVAEVAGLSPSAAAPITVRTIAERRVSDDGRAGVRAFLAKRPAPWAAPRG